METFSVREGSRRNRRGRAVSDERIWAVLRDGFDRSYGRVEGDHAVGLARFAKRNPEADAWAVVGKVRPSWLR